MDTRDLDAAKKAVACETIYYDSSDGKTHIHALAWLPEGDAAQKPRGIVQIAHGMVEHVERYDDFARFLAANGYAVCANDHIGHGGSVESEDKWGCLPENGATVMVNDVNGLRQLFSKRFPEDTPYFVFGHSMGSFIIRAYLAHYGRGLAGAIICGTGQQPIATSKFAAWLSRRIGASKGMDYRSPFMDNLGAGSYAKKIPNARTNLDWLNTDSARVDEYIADPACGMMFSVGGYASLTDLTAEVATKECAAAVPDNLPVLFISGEGDPVGDFGKGVEAASKAMKENSLAKVSVVIYKDMRHEILNEPEHMKVYADILQWLRMAAGDKDNA